MRTALTTFIFLLLIATSLIGIAVYVTFYRSMPLYDATIAVQGLQRPVTVVWDEYAVPHLFADQDEDLYFATGYIHAQERLWQMTLSQMASEGRFAEFFGAVALQNDQYFHTIGIPKVAREILNTLPDDEMMRLQRYADGVNAWVNANPEKIPMEFVLLDIDPIPWEPLHTIGAMRLLGWEMNVGWWPEMTYGRLRETLGEPYWRELLPSYNEIYSPLPDSLSPDSTLVPVELQAQQPASEGSVSYNAANQVPVVRQAHQPFVGEPGRRTAVNLPLQGQPNPNPFAGRTSSDVSSSALTDFLALEMNVRRALGKSVALGGSNAWAVAAHKSSTGFPLLAGDPHTGLTVPVRWYEMHMNRSGQNVSGATIPGIPYIIFGQNDHAAWTFTNALTDETDFFYERIRQGAEETYEFGIRDSVPHHEPIRYERHILSVKNEDDIIHTTRFTRNGPIISDLLGQTDKTVSMRWTGHQTSNELSAMYAINWSDRFERTTDVLPSFKVPSVHFVYADVTGNIARFLTGDVPRRSFEAFVPAEGWNPDHIWSGSVPFNELPHQINPASGYVADANQPIEKEGIYLGMYWDSASRYRVITDRLLQSTVLTPEEMLSIQNETLSQHARDVMRIVLPVMERAPKTPLEEQALSYLRNWDFRYDKSATAASIFDFFFLNLTRKALFDDLPADAHEAFLRNEGVPLRVLSRMLEKGSRFWDDKNTFATETRDEIIVASMKDAIRQLADTLGTEPILWRWENLHQLHLQPPFLTEIRAMSNSRLMDRIALYVMNRGPYPTAGHSTTPNSGQYDLNSPFSHTAGAGIRRVVDLSQTRQSMSVLAGGQSGNPLSRHYDDQIDLWLEGKYRIFQHHSEIRFNSGLSQTRLTPPSP